ncbi:MAG TPA: enoyl-CoA hydratase-related protein [Acidimicrobiales bacterium]|nr:enoyl-CoA hydratase-related protein [Acidimicrobiales bacterium]
MELAAGQVIYESGGASRVARLTINRPERRNALSWEVVRALREGLALAKADEAVRVLVLAGSGDTAFCAGADLGSMAGEDALGLHAERGQLAGLFEDLWKLGKPTIAEVRGYALAGGFALALACDLVVASDDAVFGAPEIDVGLWPFMAMVPFVRSMPPKVALELMLTGRRVDSTEAGRIGFTTRTVPAAQLSDEVAKLAAQLASKAPRALKLGRDAFYDALDLPAHEALALLHPLLSVVASGDEAREGIAAFKEKRPPIWSGG